MNVKKLSIAIALPIVLLLSGCAVTSHGHTDPHASAAAQPSKPASDPLVKNFGEVVTYDDGVSVSVSAPSPYTVSDSAMGQISGQQNLVVTIVITNNSKKTLDIVGTPNAKSGGQQAASIADLQNNVGDWASGPLIAGQSIKWQSAFSVVDPTSLTVAYSPDFDHKDAIFTNAKG